MTDQAVRYLILTASFVCCLELAGFLYAYWRTVIPLRKVREADLIAPPVRVTFLYHLLVLGLLLNIIFGTVIRISNDDPLIWPSYVTAAITIALTVVLNRFMKYYVQILRKGVEL